MKNLFKNTFLPDKNTSHEQEYLKNGKKITSTSQNMSVHEQK